MSTDKLFTPVTLGGNANPIQLQHRVVMAPLARHRADENGLQPEMTATYYKQRATPGGLQITEATSISGLGRGVCYSPGLFTEAQVEAWKPVTLAVHEKQGIIFAQIRHSGRVGNKVNHPDQQLPVSSSAKHPAALDALKVQVPDPVTRALVSPTRALETDEIPGICLDFQTAAVNALAAGFDGVEVHAANGYLLEQFLFDEINDRTDKYGGPIENRARIIFEVLDAIVAKVDSSRVGIRISPFSLAHSQKATNPVEDTTYVLKKLAEYDLAYVHVVEPRGLHGVGPLAPPEGITPLFRKLYPGVLITSSGYDSASAKKVVEDGQADLVAIGRAFIANPDLVERFRRESAPMNELDVKTMYHTGAKGYIDYPFLDATA